MSEFPTDLFAGRSYQIVGLGRNGLPAARALRAMGAEVSVWDDQENARASALDEGFTLHDPATGLAGIAALILSPGIPHLLPKPHPAALAAQAAGVPILSDAELLFQAVRRAGSRARFVGVTGTNGKSTTTSLIAHILTCAGIPNAAGGNLGPAALALPLLPDHGVYVLEMSSYLLERIATLRFDAAIMLNLTPDHLDRHGDMAGYAAAKKAIFARQTAADLSVVGVDDDYSRAFAVEHGPARLVRITEHSRKNSGAAAPPDLWPEGEILFDHTGPRFDLASAPALPGGHNAENIAASLAVVEHLGVARDIAAKAVQSFEGLPHRQRLIAFADGVAWIDDSKATNADATARALACYDRVIWIAGGLAKSGGIESLAPYFRRIMFALLIGADAPLLAVTLKQHQVPHRIVETMDKAVAGAAVLALSEQAPVVLLSPACASFDQYPGFEARGEHFAALVRARIAAGEIS
jgi:UDP-N-acetylmuramoylalanine--D-glutamate ligase